MTLTFLPALAGCAATSASKRAVASVETVTVAPPDPLAEQRAFFENLRALCGQTFGGRTILAPVKDRTFEPARLYIVVKECKADEIRVSFIVGDDASRTWVFHLRNDGLKFTHEHLRPDGTAYELSGFGGNAAKGGSPVYQSFPYFANNADTPLAQRQTWRLRLDTEHEVFLYYLDMGGAPLYQLATLVLHRHR